MIPHYRKPPPLAMALGPMNPPPSEARTSLPSPRLVSLFTSELPREARPGDRITLSAFIKSMDSDGNATLAVMGVTEEPPQAEQKIYVTPPESPTP